MSQFASDPAGKSKLHCLAGDISDFVTGLFSFLIRWSRNETFINFLSSRFQTFLHEERHRWRTSSVLIIITTGHLDNLKGS